MAKKIFPYIKFSPGEYTSGNITSCNIIARGLYVDVECFYWGRGCELTQKEMFKRFGGQIEIKVKDKVVLVANGSDHLQELIDDKIIKIRSGKVIISFILNQYKVLCGISETNSKNGRKGAEERERRKALKPTEDFATVCKSDEEWMNKMCIKHAIKNHIALHKWIDAFQKQLEKIHPTIAEYKKHFSNWLNKQPKEITSTSKPKAFKE